MAKELAILTTSPPVGISCYTATGGDPHRLLEAVVLGTPGTVNAGGTFKLEVAIPNRSVCGARHAYAQSFSR
jgi:ubiquitin-protein ligase